MHITFVERTPRLEDHYFLHYVLMMLSIIIRSLESLN